MRTGVLGSTGGACHDGGVWIAEAVCRAARTTLRAVMSAARVDLGNVPQWVAGVLSGVSLILALYIVLRDRRKAEREQAEQVVVSWGVSMRSGVVVDAGQEVSIY